VVSGTATTAAVQADPEVARRAWPRWLALGLALMAVAAVAAFWTGGGARLLLGALGLFGLVRGAVLVAGARRSDADPRARGLGVATAGVGAVALAVAAVPGTLAGWVLLVVAPVGMLVASLYLVARGGTARRSGLVALLWSVLVTGLLVVTGLVTDWERARGGATVVGALGVAALGMVLLAGSAGLRAAAARPVPPAQPAGCGGCACSGGGCGSLA
jgi:hypothetical protein